MKYDMTRRDRRQREVGCGPRGEQRCCWMTHDEIRAEQVRLRVEFYARLGLEVPR